MGAMSTGASWALIGSICVAAAALGLGLARTSARADRVCAERFADCMCGERAGHRGPHVCAFHECNGSWRVGAVDGVQTFEVIRLPGIEVRR